MHRSRALAVVGALTAGAGLLLPFVTLPPLGGIDGIAADAWPSAALAGAAALLLLTGDRGDTPARPVAVAASLAGGAAVGFAVVKVLDAWWAAADVPGSVGSGAWVVAAGTAAAFAGCLLGLGRRI